MCSCWKGSIYKAFFVISERKFVKIIKQKYLKMKTDQKVI